MFGAIRGSRFTYLIVVAGLMLAVVTVFASHTALANSTSGQTSPCPGHCASHAAPGATPLPTQVIVIGGAAPVVVSPGQLPITGGATVPGSSDSQVPLGLGGAVLVVAGLLLLGIRERTRREDR